jgi:hypothetical protein
MQTITVTLPEDIYRRLHDVAQNTHQPLEDVVYQSIEGNLPPSLIDLPLALQQELTPLLKMDDRALWTIARQHLSSKQWQRHQRLLAQAQQDRLSEQEQEELTHLRTLTDQFVLRRSYALAILKWRGYSLPSSDDLPTS